METITIHLDYEQNLNWIALNDVWNDTDLENSYSPYSIN